MTEKIRTNDAGEIEVINQETGELVAVGKSKKKPKNGTIRAVVKAGQRKTCAVFVYNDDIKDRLLELITDGKTLKAACKEPGMPPKHVVYGWTRKYPEFKKELNQAREDRAEAYHDQAIETAEKASRKTIKQDKLKVDTYKWAASVGNKEQYGKKGDGGGGVGSVNILIDTGFGGAPRDVKCEVSDD